MYRTQNTGRKAPRARRAEIVQKDADLIPKASSILRAGRGRIAIFWRAEAQKAARQGQRREKKRGDRRAL